MWTSLIFCQKIVFLSEQLCKWLLPGTVCSFVLILNVMPREITWATTSMWPFPEHQSERLCFLPCLLRSLYSAIPPAPFFFLEMKCYFRMHKICWSSILTLRMLWVCHFSKKKSQKFYIWWLCICFFGADKWCCNCIRREAPFQTSPLPATLFFICFLEVSFFIYIFTGINYISVLMTEWFLLGLFHADSQCISLILL